MTFSLSVSTSIATGFARMSQLSAINYYTLYLEIFRIFVGKKGGLKECDRKTES
jgi:hypothetical protein